jgi:predicted lipoprotein with Yx(FWY)xxD motif
VKRSTVVYGAVGAVLIAAVGFAAWRNLGSLQARSDVAPLATPQGVTLQPLGRAQGYDLGKTTASIIARDQIAYTNARGLTLYTWDQDPPGKSTCVDACAEIFAPFLAPEDRQTVRGWSVVRRNDGAKQWALKGKPLYTYAKDIDPGSVAGISPADSGAPRKNALGVMVGGGNRGEFHDAKLKNDPLPDGWKPALLYPIEGMKLPAGIAIKELPDAAVFALVDRGGYTLYTFGGGDVGEAQRCAATTCKKWQPLRAPQLDVAVGDFSILERDDGIRQWAYQGGLLYKYADDLAPGYAEGVGVDPRWTVAAVIRYYMPPTVSIRKTPGLGSVLATANGMTLYRRDGYILQSGGGHSLRRGQPSRPAVGRDIGTDPRCGSECEKMWHPFLASAAAEGWGFWNVASRTDGTTQWVYQGYALWTYDGDRKPGDMNGHDTYDIAVSDDPTKMANVGTPMDGGAALWWSVALP